MAASSGLFLHGERETGTDVRTANVRAAVAVSNLVKSSLGPVGLDKMLVDEIGDVTITNDGATVLGQMEIEHPAARVLVDLAQLQDREVGDGTTSVVILAAELLRRGNALIAMGKSIHPTSVISGYKLALKQAVAHLKKNMVVPVDDLTDDHLLSAAATSMSSKLLDAEVFAPLAVAAVKAVKRKNGKYPVSAIHVLKAHGKSSADSHLVVGFALNACRAAQGMPTEIHTSEETGPVKIAMLDMNLQRHRMAMGVQITVKDVAEIENIQRRELDITKERIRRILDAGARIVLTTKGVDDTCMKYFVEAGVLCARRVPREDLKRLAVATGGQVVTTMADLEGNEAFDSDSLGTCDSCTEERVGDGEMLYLRGCHGAGAATVVLRGANEYMLDEMDRALHDAACVVSRMLEHKALVAGGGAVESGLSVHLEEHAIASLEGREQLAVQEYAQALLVIPRTLAVNAAVDSAELVAALRAVHAAVRKGTRPPEDIHTGLDLVDGVVRNNLVAGVVEPAISKIKSLRFATEAAITILRIDDRITLAAKEPVDPRGRRR